MIVTRNKFILLIIGLVLVAWKIYAIGFDAGYSEINTAALEGKNAQYEKLQKERDALADRVSRIDQKFTSEKIDLQKQIDQLKKEAANYEPPKETTCDNDNLDPEWVRVHNSAADLSRVQNPESSSVDDGKPGAATKNQAIATIADNYATCAVHINQLKGLQDFIRTISQ